VPSLSDKEIKEANTSVKNLQEKKVTRKNPKTPTRYNDYTPEERASIGKYAAENGIASAVRHFSRVGSKKVPETTARRLKTEYLQKMKELVKGGGVAGGSGDAGITEDNAVAVVKILPTKAQGRPLLLGAELDKSVQEYVSALRVAGGVVNTAIVQAAALGIVGARDSGLLREHGGHIDISKPWAKSLLKRMGYEKRKGSNAGKLTVSQFKEIQEEFLADIKAEVVMNEIPNDLIFNWDQTGLQLVPTGQWTMHRAGEKVIAIANSDDKRQITAVFAATMTGEYFPPQVIYKGKTLRCHPKVDAPKGWDIWHSDNHWSNEETMKRYIEKIIVPFISQKRKSLDLPASQPALAIFDCFRGQTTPDILTLLEKHNIIAVQVPAHCTDKLQPMDISINKPVKDEMKKRFQSWYAAEVQKQLKDVPLGEVKVDVASAAIKTKSANWIISAWQALEGRPEVAVNGFKKAGIYDAVTKD
jgi:hypothetical protein